MSTLLFVILVVIWIVIAAIIVDCFRIHNENSRMIRELGESLDRLEANRAGE